MSFVVDSPIYSDLPHSYPPRVPCTCRVCLNSPTASNEIAIEGDTAAGETSAFAFEQFLSHRSAHTRLSHLYRNAERKVEANNQIVRTVVTTSIALLPFLNLAATTTDHAATYPSSASSSSSNIDAPSSRGIGKRLNTARPSEAERV